MARRRITAEDVALAWRSYDDAMIRNKRRPSPQNERLARRWSHEWEMACELFCRAFLSPLIWTPAR